MCSYSIGEKVNLEVQGGRHLLIFSCQEIYYSGSIISCNPPKNPVLGLIINMLSMSKGKLQKVQVESKCWSWCSDSKTQAAVLT